MSRSCCVKACRATVAAASIASVLALWASSPSFGQAAILVQAQGRQAPEPTPRPLLLRGPEIICETPDYQACLDAFARKHGLPPRRPDTKVPAGDSPR